MTKSLNRQPWKNERPIYFLLCLQADRAWSWKDRCPGKCEKTLRIVRNADRRGTVRRVDTDQRRSSQVWLGAFPRFAPSGSGVQNKRWSDLYRRRVALACPTPKRGLRPDPQET